MANDRTTHTEADDQALEKRRVRRQLALALLDSWDRATDEAEQRETLAQLKQAIDDNRSERRAHFP